MDKIIKIIVLLFICDACINTKNYKNKSEVVATINNDTIFLSDLDSIIDGYIYGLRLGYFKPGNKFDIVRKTGREGEYFGRRT